MSARGNFSSRIGFILAAAGSAVGHRRHAGNPGGRIIDTCIPGNVRSGDEIQVRKIMNMTLSIDHRIANGTYAGQFLDLIYRILITGRNSLINGPNFLSKIQARFGQIGTDHLGGAHGPGHQAGRHSNRLCL